MYFDKEYGKRKNGFEEYLKGYLSNLNHIPEPLLSSMIYALSGGGKRLRPVLFLSCSEAFGASDKDSVNLLALAIECIHTYSLIHDDLPCMDNADLRRGKPTCHKVYGESIAVLTGDALLNLTYELMFKAVSISSSDNARRFVRAAKLIADNCGATGLIGGQVVDTVVDSSRHLSAKLNYIHQHKTADLISAAMTAGAIVGGATNEDIETIAKIGDNIGFAFQIVDDILDSESGEDEGKCSFVNVYGKKEARNAVADKTALALDLLLKLKGDFSFIHSLISHLSLRKE